MGLDGTRALPSGRVLHSQGDCGRENGGRSEAELGGPGSAGTKEAIRQEHMELRS